VEVEVTRKIEVVDYTCRWAETFEFLKARLLGVVDDIALAIVAAKPVIDLDIVVEDEDVPLAIERLATLGYEHRGDLGIPRREAFRGPGGIPSHNLYVCPKDSPALANHLAVRDHLRANPDAAAEYGELKKRLAARFPNDINSYIEGKSEFLLGILRQAGFAEEALLDIEVRNRAAGVVLREIVDGDLEHFFRFESEPEAIHMAAFTAKDPTNRAAFDAHWTKIRSSDSVTIRTIEIVGEVAGNVLSYEESLGPEVCFWLGRDFWGRGAATEALREFVTQVDNRRPMRARAAADNAASLRVLAKCGFEVVGEDRGFANARGEEIDEYVLELGPESE
jgi:GrpB-like predicted nucleotidyltransferase (UPF0157 family)/RimJ/RimL family protein N-acetyltransferase